MHSKKQGHVLLHIDEADVSEKEKIEQRQKSLQSISPRDFQNDSLFSYSFDPEIVCSRNCENVIGSVEIPVGLVGPIPIFTSHDTESEDIYIPLATTEGALVASTSRGSKAIRQSGGAQVVVKNNGMTRAPVFMCRSGMAAHQFSDWLSRPQQVAQIKKRTEATSNHLRFISHTSFIRGRHVYTRFNFDTGEAMGMNMVTIALQKALPELLRKSPVDVDILSLSSNVCVDKKDSTINALLGRGWWAQAEVCIPNTVLWQILKLNGEDVQKLVTTHVAKNVVGSNLAGSHAQNMQAANIIAAFYTATGQDIAHVGEASQVFTSVEQEKDGVYFSVTLPDLPLGTVGGGTHLLPQTQARSCITPHKKVTSQTLATAVAVGVLAAEISGLAALASQTLAKAHERLGRSTK